MMPPVLQQYLQRFWTSNFDIYWNLIDTNVVLDGLWPRLSDSVAPRHGLQTYLVPTRRSKNRLIGIFTGSSFSIALKTSSSTIPRTPPLFGSVLGSDSRHKLTHPNIVFVPQQGVA